RRLQSLLRSDRSSARLHPELTARPFRGVRGPERRADNGRDGQCDDEVHDPPSNFWKTILRARFISVKEVGDSNTTSSGNERSLVHRLLTSRASSRRPWRWPPPARRPSIRRS